MCRARTCVRRGAGEALEFPTVAQMDKTCASVEISQGIPVGKLVDKPCASPVVASATRGKILTWLEISGSALAVSKALSFDGVKVSNFDARDDEMQAHDQCTQLRTIWPILTGDAQEMVA